MNTIHTYTPPTIEDLFGASFNTPPAPPAKPENKVFEFIFAFGNEEYPREVQVTENYYTEDEFSKVADEVFATSYEPVEFTKRERVLTIN